MRVTIVIATLDRPADLQVTLEGWRNGTILPAEVRVVDASAGNETCQICTEDWSPLQVVYLRSPVRSAAQQRNLGAEGCTSELILFCDDDIEFPSDTLERMVGVFREDVVEQIGGVAGVQVGLQHKPPCPFLRYCYRLLSGYDDETYGGRFFGPAINIIYTDRPSDPLLYPAEWLDSCLVVYRNALFQRERFPLFAGYSFQEDVNLSVRISRTHQLYFHRGVRYIHNRRGGIHKRDPQRLGMMQFTNRWYNATTLLGLTGFDRVWKFTLSQVISTVWLLRSRPPGWEKSLSGAWYAWWNLAVRHRDVGQFIEASQKNWG